MNPAPFISFVVVTRNDNHGDCLKYRTQEFINLLVYQCNKYQLYSELIIVEWNPPKEKSKLVDQFEFPNSKYLNVRIIEVPEGIHNTYKLSKNLPLYQMIGKNVGIARAVGKYVLATNIDIIFSDKVFIFIKNQIRDNHLYTAIRHDIPSRLPVGGDKILWASKYFFRIHHKLGSIQIHSAAHHYYSFFGSLYVIYIIYIKSRINRPMKMYKKSSKKSSHSPLSWKAIFFCPINYFVNFFKNNPIDHIKNLIERNKIRISNGFALIFQIKSYLLSAWKNPHTNACGDFTLCSKKMWETLRGYPEWDMMSWHLDSVLVFQAKNSGFKTKTLNGKIFHIEHSPGSGYTPENASILFDRLNASEISYLSENEFIKIISDQQALKKPIQYNCVNWGLSNKTLLETSVT